MLEKKALQHLDIKPENLLLVGDRIKVADFGLVKELEDQVNTFVGGLTPVYASPEVFAGTPSRQSDQYSLAIVYQQMLTGSLPFPGRTQQQLAIQHRQLAPRLETLSSLDREVLTRALAKDPAQRFPSCGDFVAALSQRHRTFVGNHQAVVPDGAERVAHVDTLPSGDTTARDQAETTVAGKSDASSHGVEPADALCTELLAEDEHLPSGSVPLPRFAAEEQALLVKPSIQELGPIDVSEALSEPRPTLLIGIGGSGARVLQGFKQRLAACAGLATSEAIQVLLLDTDGDTLQQARFAKHGAGLEHEELLHLGLRRPQEYQALSDDLLRWLSRRWLYNIPRSRKTQGYRPLGRLAWVDHLDRVRETLRKRISRLVADDSIKSLEAGTGLPCHNRAPRIVLVGSTSGGTASGMLLDALRTVRSLLNEMRLPDDSVSAILMSSTNTHPRESTLAIASTYAFLSELQQGGTLPSGVEASKIQTGPGVNKNELPPATVYFVNLGEQLSDELYDERISEVAEYLFCSTATAAGGLLDRCRAVAPAIDRDDVQLRSFGLAALQLGDSDLPKRWSEQLRRRIVQRWLESDANGDSRSASSSVDITDPESVGPADACQGEDATDLDQVLIREFADIADVRVVKTLRQLILRGSTIRGIAPTGATAGEPADRAVVFIREVATELRELGADLCMMADPKTRRRDEETAGRDEDRRKPGSSLPTASASGTDSLDREIQRVIPTLAQSLAVSVIQQHFRTTVLAEGTSPEKQTRLSLRELLQVAVRSALASAVRRVDRGREIRSDGRLYAIEESIERHFDSATVRLPGCSYARRCFVVDRQDASWRENPPNLRDATFVPGPVDRTVFCQEAEGISLAQLADWLTQTRPELRDAAAQLHTRIDVKWTRPTARRVPADD